jgi:hypothetical protein
MLDEPELLFGADVDAATFAAAFGESLDVALDLRTWHPGQDLAALYDRLAAEVAAAVEQENRLLPAFREQVFPRLASRPGAPPARGSTRSPRTRSRGSTRGCCSTATSRPATAPSRSTTRCR